MSDHEPIPGSEATTDLDDQPSSPRASLAEIFRATNCGSALTVLDLQRCSLTELPAELASAMRLKLLNISGNRLSSSAGLRLISAVTSLEELNMDFNQLVLSEETLVAINATFPNLTQLSLSFQSDSANYQILEVSVEKFHKLLSLNASGSGLNNLQTVHCNGLLERLALHSNGLTRLPDFEDCNDLRVLDISNNCLAANSNYSSSGGESCFLRERFDELINRFSKLSCLDIAGNRPAADGPLKRHDLFATPEKRIALVGLEPCPELCRVAFANTFADTSTSCVCVLPMDSGRGDDGQELLVAVVRETSMASELRKELPLLLRKELTCPETSNDYLKNTLLACYRFLKSDIAPSSPSKHSSSKSLNIVLCHLVPERTSSDLRVTLAASGQDIAVHLIDTKATEKNSRIRSLSPRHANCSGGSWENADSQPPELLLDPVTHEFSLSDRTKVLLIGLHAKSISDSSVHSELSSLGEHFNEETLASDDGLNDSLKRYSERTKGLPDCGHALLALQAKNFKNFVDFVDTDELDEQETDFNEKYRSWEYILEENTQRVFQQQLDTATLPPPMPSAVYASVIRPKSHLNNLQNNCDTQFVGQLAGTLLTTFKI